jgi:hypothetical protein
MPFPCILVFKLKIVTQIVLILAWSNCINYVQIMVRRDSTVKIFRRGHRRLVRGSEGKKKGSLNSRYSDIYSLTIAFDQTHTPI